MAYTVTDRYTEVAGPFKREVVFFETDATSGTIESRLQDPQYFHLRGVNSTLLGIADGISLSGKVASFTNLTASGNYRVEFLGF